jgi:hypothetical protein
MMEEKVMRKMMKAIALSLLLGAGPLLGAPALTFYEGTGGFANNQDQSVGWQFDVLSPVMVTGLGWFDEGGDGLVTAHMVGVWDGTGTLLTSVLVPAGTAASLDGQFRTVGITPIVLGVGTGYIVGGENFFSNTERLASRVDQTVDPRLRYIDATFSNIGSGFVRPTQFSVADTGFYGPSFSLDSVPPIPAPGALVLGMLGAGSATWLRRRRAI